MRICLRTWIAPLLARGPAARRPAQERDRSKVPDKYKWNLADIYPDDAAWRPPREASPPRLPKLRAFQGKLGAFAATLADALELTTRLDKESPALYVYASMLADQDTRASEPQGMQQEMQQLAATFGAAASFIEPEILKAGAATVEKFIAARAAAEGLHASTCEDIVRRAPHTLTDSEEKILADAGPLAASPSNIYGILSNADFPYPSVTLSDGKTVKLDQAGYSALRAVAEPRRSREGDVDVLQGAGRLQPHLGTTMNAKCRRCCSTPRRESTRRARVVARRAEHPDVGLHAPDRRREPEPADVPPLSEAAQADDGRRPAALLRSLCAAGRVGRI